MTTLNRRFALKCIGLGGTWLGFAKPASSQGTATPDAESATNATVISWSDSHDRVWLGGEVWANPMENWEIVDGAAECLSFGGDRNVHALTAQIDDASGSFSTSVVVQQAEAKDRGEPTGAGFRVGVRSDINDYRANCFAKNGISAGIVGGKLVLGKQSQPVEVDLKNETLLTLIGKPKDGRYELTLAVADDQGNPIAQISETFASGAIAGNIAIVSGLNLPEKQKGNARFRLSEWMIEGDAIKMAPDQSFGPILWSMYSLSDSRGEDGFVMTSTVLTGPMGTADTQNVEFYLERDGDWELIEQAALDTDAWTATVKVTNWDETKPHRYRWLYRELNRIGEETATTFDGTIRENPSGRPLRIGAMTCQNDYGFPYQPVADNVVKLDPDLVYFSGDQIYEGHGGYGIIREPAEPAILNYLRKFYQFGWAFREAMRDRPTICLPDDHDVFQGNIWGEGGAPMDVGDSGASSKGGYIEPARMVNVVHRTNTSHHPEPYDATAVKQGISVYYGDMVYGDVGFAILSDRQFKSGPERVDTGGGRADHVPDPDFDTSTLDGPDLVLLGERQERFLREWADDWRGHKMKVVLSQTVFSSVATHHGGFDGYLKADLDSGGWPQTARNRAIEIMRPSKALHINGDQHLTSMSQYGVAAQRDGNWSFCTPAISAGYPRWWRPDQLQMPHANRPKHGLPDTGEFIEGFGNKVYVYAVGNPEVATKKNRYERAHQKASGFGLVTIDTEAKTYLCEAFRFLVDPTDGNPENQFPGWPVTIHMDENAGENRIE